MTCFSLRGVVCLCRHAPWAFVLQNVLGMCFMVLALRSIQLPSTAVATLLLGLLFVYDVFMVFITPIFMPNGESVMIKVATGGSAHEVSHLCWVKPMLIACLSGTISALQPTNRMCSIGAASVLFGPTHRAYHVGGVRCQ